MPNLDTLSVTFKAKGTQEAVENIKAMGLAIRGLAANINTIDVQKIDALSNSMKQLKSSAPTKDQSARITNFGNAISGLSNQFQNVDTNKLSDFATIMNQIKTSAPTKEQSGRFSGFNAALWGLSHTVKDIDGSKLWSFTNSLEYIKSATPTKSQAERMSAFAHAVRELSVAIGQTNISEFSKDMGVLGSAVEAFKKSSVNSIQNAVAAMQNMKQTAEATAHTVQTAIPKQANGLKMNDNRGTLEETKEIIASLDKVQVKATGVRGVLEKMGVTVPTKKFNELADSAEKVRRKYEEIRATLQHGLNTGAITHDSTDYKKKIAELDALRNSYDQLILKQKELALTGEGFTLNPKIQQGYEGIKTTLTGVKQAFSGVSSIVGTTNRYIDIFIGKLRSVGKSSKSVKKDTTSLTDAARKLSNEFFRVSKMLKLMVTRMALRKVIAEVGNGFKSLAIHSDEFNNSMSGLMNASKQLGYSFSSMVSPLINAFAPALIYIIGLLTKLANAFNQVMSALTGATTWNKAKNFTDSWRDSLEESTKSAKETSKEIKKSVLGFDELNQLQANSENERNTPKGGGGIADMFETLPIEQKWKDLANYIKNLAKRLFEPIKKAWEKMGDFVKKSWKYAMDEIKKLGASVARDFWKVWQQEATQKIFENIFETIGWIGVAVGNLARQFRKAWDENDTGLHILEAIRDIILIISEHIKNMAKATAEWADKLDFRPLLTSIQGWLESLKPAMDAIMGILEDFYTQVVLKFTKWVIESGLPALIDVFTRFNEEVDWDLLRERLSKLWEHLEPFTETVGEGLIIFIERVTSALAKFINGDTFADFLERLGQWMDTVTPEDVADAIEKLVKALIAFKTMGVVISVINGLGGALGALVKVASGIGTIASGISSVITALAGLSGLGVVAAVIAAIALGMYSFVESYGGFEGALDKIKSEVDDITTSFKKLADEVKLSTEIENLKTSVSGLADSLGDMKAIWDVILVVIKTVVKFIEGYAIPLFKDGVTNIKNLIDTISNYIKVVEKFIEQFQHFFSGNKVERFKAATEWWNAVHDATASGIALIEGIVQTFSDNIIAIFRGIKYALVGDPIVIDMWNAIENVFRKSVQDVINFVTDLKNKIIELFTGIKISVDEKIQEMKQKLDEWRDKFIEIKDNIGKALVEFKEGWIKNWDESKDKLNTFKTDASTLLSNIKEDVSNFLVDVKKFFDKDNWTFSGVSDGLTETFKEAGNGIKGIWNKIADGLNGEYTIGSKTFNVKLPRFNGSFANGGIIEDGIFFANHSELVGRFGNGKTAVANNTQIIEGISAGVYNAVSKANSQSGGSSRYISNTIVVDGEAIARTVTKAQERQNMRYSPQMI